VALLCGLMILTTLGSAHANGPHQHAGVNSGYCPAGTCGTNGGRHAHVISRTVHQQIVAADL
jgi:hypothetical protein